MSKRSLNWQLTHKKGIHLPELEPIPATVPGAVQLDYAKAFGYKDYFREENYKQFRWMEDEYWVYTATLDFNVKDQERAIVHFSGIDYEYAISVNGEELIRGEGMYTPVELDVTAYSGKSSELKVTVFPAPKCHSTPVDRSQARESCKPPAAYGWDWHPRLIPLGIWEEAYLELIPYGSPLSLECSYTLSDDLNKATLSCECDVYGSGTLTLTLTSPDGQTAYSETQTFTNEQNNIRYSFSLTSPKLWYPRGYGEQPIYTLTVSGSSEKKISRSIGFRRVKLIRNYMDTAIGEATFPKSRYSSPSTFEINGKQIFAKGSNWVNTEIFPSLMTEERYRELIDLAAYANMNVFRIWGGGFVNKESFFDICDRKGIMIWQEFMLACNLYPDKDAYLNVLKKEAATIIKRLRTHPCLTLWCGGNELFNSWSGMTEQSHALRLLDKLCYEHDRFTPFNMTSPLTDMAHGNYHNIVEAQKSGTQRLDRLGAGFEASISETRECLSVLTECNNVAYTEFGCCGGATPEYIKKYIMSENDYQDCSENNPIWVAHHAFEAWMPSSWLRKDEVDYYFGGYNSVDDLLQKTLIIQSVCYKSMFEEMRKQWRHCSMAINWDFNEPWPCAAGNSLVNWPAEPKPALESVRQALRPQLSSIRTGRNRYFAGETLTGELWMLNDSDDVLAASEVTIELRVDGKSREISTLSTGAVEPRSNLRSESFSLEVPNSENGLFEILLSVKDKPELSSEYTLFSRKNQ